MNGRPRLAGKPRDGELGFTLAELLVTIVVLAVVVVPLGGSLVVAMRTTGDADQRLVEANDGRALAAALVPDIQSAAAVSTTDPGCGGAGTRLLVRQRPANGTTLENRAAYVVVASGARTQLVRRSCAGSAVVTEQVLVRDLPSGASFTVTCAARPPASTPPGVDVTVTVQHPTTGATVVTAGTRTSDGACA